MNKPSIIIGKREAPALDRSVTLICEDPELRPHQRRPWLLRFVEEQAADLGLPELDIPEPGVADEDVAVEDWMLERHVAIYGNTGSGKTRLAALLLQEQMRRGCSILVMEPKAKTVGHIAAMAKAVGIPAKQIVLLTPGRGIRDVPGWNPFLTGLPVSQVVKNLTHLLLHHLTDASGKRMDDLMTNGLTIVGEHKLSLMEFDAFLKLPTYRATLLATEIVPREPGAYETARWYFQTEFDQMSRSEQASAVTAVMNKIRELIRSEFFQAMFCAVENTLDLRRLWREQTIIILHLDRTSLGESGAHILGAFFSYQLLNTALSTSGPVPVVLALDELGFQAKYIEGPLRDIIAVARSQNLRLVGVCQFLDQLPVGFRAALLSGPAVQVFFSLGSEDASHVAKAFSRGVEPQPTHLHLKTSKGVDGEIEWEEVQHIVLDPEGHPVRMDRQDWRRSRFTDFWEYIFVQGRHGFFDEIFCDQPDDTPLSSESSDLGWLRDFGTSRGIPRWYVRDSETERPVEIGRYVAELPPTHYRLNVIGGLLNLVIRFPRPRVSQTRWRTSAQIEDAWVRIIQGLPNQHAVARFRGTATPVFMRVRDVPDPPDGVTAELAAYIAEAQRANSQSVTEITASAAGRRAAIEQALRNGSAVDRDTARKRTSRTASRVQEACPPATPKPALGDADPGHTAENQEKARPNTGGVMEVADDGSF